MCVGPLLLALGSKAAFTAQLAQLCGPGVAEDDVQHAARYLWDQIARGGGVVEYNDETMERLYQLHRERMAAHRRAQGGMDVDGDLLVAGLNGEWLGNDSFLASAAITGGGVHVVKGENTFEFPAPDGSVSEEWRVRCSGAHYDVDVRHSRLPTSRPAWIAGPSEDGNASAVTDSCFHLNHYASYARTVSLTPRAHGRPFSG